MNLSYLLLLEVVKRKLSRTSSNKFIFLEVSGRNFLVELGHKKMLNNKKWRGIVLAEESQVIT